MWSEADQRAAEAGKDAILTAAFSGFGILFNDILAFLGLMGGTLMEAEDALKDVLLGCDCHGDKEGSLLLDDFRL